MSRPPKTPVEPADSGFNEQRLQEAGAAAAQLGQLQNAYSDGRDLVNQLLGQTQMASALSQFCQTVGISKLATVKEHKLYQQLAGSRTPNGLELKGTWAEFCSLLGMSDEKANQDIANLQAFGEAALDQMKSVGIGYRDLRQFRKLPADQRTALIEAAKSGDKESFIDLAEDIIAKHGKEKEQLNLSISGKDELLERKQNMIDLQATQIDELGKKARFIATASPSEKLQGIRAELLEHALDVVSTLVGKLRPAFAKLKEHLDEHGGECDAYLSGALGQIERAVRELREDYGLLRAEDVAPWANAD